MQPPTAQVFELAGENRGAVIDGFVDNFAMGELEIAADSSVDFVDEFDNSPGAGCEVLYVRTLSLGPSSTLTLHGCNIYYTGLGERRGHHQ